MEINQISIVIETVSAPLPLIEKIQFWIEEEARKNKGKYPEVVGVHIKKIDTDKFKKFQSYD